MSEHESFDYILVTKVKFGYYDTWQKTDDAQNRTDSVQVQAKIVLR